MLTLPAAGRLLAEAHDAASLHSIALACGFAGDPAPLDAAARSALGLPAFIRAASVVQGRGMLRALCLDARPGTLTRDTLAALTLRLQRRAPFALWLVTATEPRGVTVALGVASIAAPPRASVLMADRPHILDSDADTLRALAGAADGPDVLVHDRWCELLGRDALTLRFFRALDATVGRLASSITPRVSATDARGLALLTTTRLLFLAFLEARGWLDGDHGFLRRSWDDCTMDTGGYHRNVLNPLCFGTLNTPRSRRAARARAFGRVPFLNGGLFTRSVLERVYSRVVFPDEALGALVVDLIGRWRFTIRENTATHAEAAVDPEMLGRAFESLMASRERRASGTFYTPRALVARVTDAAFDAALDASGAGDILAAARSGHAIPPERGAVLAAPR